MIRWPFCLRSTLARRRLARHCKDNRARLNQPQPRDQHGRWRKG